MISLPLYDRDGRVVEQVNVEAAALGGVVRKKLLRHAVDMYQARQHVGTASAKNRSEIAGSNRKLWRQKGTGRARVSTRKTTIWRGGGRAFPPKARDCGYAVSKRMRRLAAQSALLARLEDGDVKVVDDISIDAPRTKVMVGLLRALEARFPCLLVLEKHDEVLWKSTRNIAGVSMCSAAELNAYDLLRAVQVIFTRNAFSAALARLS